METSAETGATFNENPDGSVDVGFSQQIIDPAMVVIFLLPSLFFTSCSGVFAVDNTFGIPGGIVASIVLIVALCVASYAGVKYFNNKPASIKIIPGQGIETGTRKLAGSEIEKVGLEAASIGNKCFRVYAMSGGEKIYITEYVSASTANEIESGIRERMGKT